jgi:hypothetical protein
MGIRTAFTQKIKIVDLFFHAASSKRALFTVFNCNLHAMSI